MLGCYSCGSEPITENGQWGLVAVCPLCKVRGGQPRGDWQAALEDWDKLMYRGPETQIARIETILETF